MVNSKNLLTAGVMSLSIASIITYMQANGLTTEDITLVDACYKASEVNGINIETCDELKQHSMEWDTTIPCIQQFQEDVYFYTPRMMFNYFSNGDSDIANLGRKNKGEETLVYNSVQNLTFAEALQDRCAAASQDPTYVVFRDVMEQWNAGVAEEDIDLSKYEDRELYGWNTVAGWVKAGNRGAQSTKKAFVDVGNSAYNGAVNVGTHVVKISVGVILFVAKGITQLIANQMNYKACSLGLALKKIHAGIVDNAECSGRHPTRCRASGHGFIGWSNWWNNHDRSTNYRLNNGCVQHDKCLQDEQNNGSDKDVFWDCDEALSMAGKRGVDWQGPGWHCGWRGCAAWIVNWKYVSYDSRFIASTVWLSMGTHPNGP